MTRLPRRTRLAQAERDLGATRAELRTLEAKAARRAIEARDLRAALAESADRLATTRAALATAVRDHAALLAERDVLAADHDGRCVSAAVCASMCSRAQHWDRHDRHCTTSTAEVETGWTLSLGVVGEASS